MSLTTSDKLLDKFGLVKLEGDPTPADKGGNTYRVPLSRNLQNSGGALQVLNQAIGSMASFIDTPDLVDAKGDFTVLIGVTRHVSIESNIEHRSMEEMNRIVQFVYAEVRLFFRSIDQVAEEMMELAPSDTSKSSKNQRKQTRPGSGPKVGARR